MRSWGWSPHSGISAFIRRDPREPSLSLSLSLFHFPLLPLSLRKHVEERPCEVIARSWHLQATKRVLTRNQLCGTLIWDFYPLELWENTCLLFKPPGVWCLAVAEGAKTAPAPLWQDTAHARACSVVSSHSLCSDPAWGDLAGQALSKFKTKLFRTEASSSCKSKAFCLTRASGTDLWSPLCLNGWRAMEQLGVTDHKWAIHWIMIVNSIGGYTIQQMWNCLVLCPVNSWCPVNVS